LYSQKYSNPIEAQKALSWYYFEHWIRKNKICERFDYFLVFEMKGRLNLPNKVLKITKNNCEWLVHKTAWIIFLKTKLQTPRISFISNFHNHFFMFFLNLKSTAVKLFIFKTFIFAYFKEVTSPKYLWTLNFRIWKLQKFKIFTILNGVNEEPT
jgi:hypothetical protein